MTTRLTRRVGRWLEALESRVFLSTAPANYIPTGTNWINRGGYLTEPTHAPALQVASDFLAARAQELSLTTAQALDWVITSNYTDADTGVTHIYLLQRVNNLPVANADAAVHITADGRVISAYSRFVQPVLAGGNLGFGGGFTLTVSSALKIAAGFLNLDASANVGLVTAATIGKPGVLSSSLSLDPIPATMQYIATPAGLQPAWRFVVRTPDGQHWYDTSIGAKAGAHLATYDWVEEFASYNVYALPNDSPNDGPRTIVTGVEDPIASPFGWHDTDGNPGAEFTDTRGNNVFAQDDTNANNIGGSRPNGGASLTFDFPVNLASAPSANMNAAITNLFYMNNVLHDIHYKYGFTEVAGNFQFNNYGNGGLGNDAVQADAQDGSGLNNANFATPPDGTAPRMQMYNFTYTSPGRDGDFDNGVIIHEYGHGVSTRLTGGPANSSSLDAAQSGGMGEGWGDWWALMLTMRATDTQNAAYPIGTYVLGQTLSDPGIRRFPYSYNMAIDPLTLDAYGTSGNGGGTYRSVEVHNSGEIWCSALWDMTWLLINKYGGTIDTNLYAGYTGPGSAGNIVALKLVMDALKLQPANPSFLDARDAILQADVVLTGGANQDEIWQAFARRGMGESAWVGANANSTTVIPAFDTHWPEPRVVFSLPMTVQIESASSVDVRFNMPMDAASFSVAADVASFTGPGAVDYKPQITGFSWTDSKTLHITFTPVTVPGSYTMVLGPDILAAANGHAMDQDRDNVTGEAAEDQYSLSFSVVTMVGPDGFGYRAQAFPFENLNLTPTGSGVTAVLDNQDDASVSIPLGANAFNFYGVTITGSGQLFVSTNGRLTLYATTVSDWTNGELAADFMPVIAPLWDDWVTFNSSGGSGNDVVLYKFDTPNNRLIVEWNNVAPYGQTGAATFQAILQLNTGTKPGNITFNYVDTTIGNAAFDDGASATVGIKDDMVQGANRLVVSVNAASPWVGNGKAIRITQADAITGAVFQDNDANAARTGADTLLSGRTVYLDSNNNGALDGGEPTATTNSKGVYSFAGLAPGDYVVRQILPGGMAQTLPAAGAAYLVSLAAGGVANARDFGSAAAGAVTGTFYEDADYNLIRDGGENVLPGWTVYADVNNNGTLDAGDVSTTSVAGGTYTLSGLAPGVTYTIRYILPAGWVNSAPASGTRNVSVAIGGTTTGADFGVVQVGGLRLPDLLSSGAVGVNYTYYEPVAKPATVNALDSLIPAAIMPTGWDSNFKIASRPVGRNDLFGFIWNAYVLIPTDGIYTFYTNSDDGSTLSIGDTLVVNNDGNHTADETSGRIGLKAGLHAITVKYFDDTDAQSLVVSYESDTLARQAIPDGALFLNPTFDGGAGADDYIVRQDAANTYQQVFHNTPTTGLPVRTFLVVGMPTLTFNGNAGNDSLTLDYTHGGSLGSLVFSGGGDTDTVGVIGQNAADPIAVTATQITKPGATLAFSGAETMSLKTGAFSINADLAGMNLTLDGSATLHAGEHLGALTLAAGATLTVPAGTYRLVRATALSLGAGAAIDLADNGLVIDYTVGGAPQAAVEAAVASGYNNGAWNGAGIRSSTAAALPLAFTLGVLDNALRGAPLAAFAGEAIPTTAVIVMYTYVDDLDLDGAITTNDAITFAAHYALGSPATHRTGDIDYNGVFDSNDAIIFAAAYSTSLPPIAPIASFAAGLFAASMVAPPSVPPTAAKTASAEPTAPAPLRTVIAPPAPAKPATKSVAQKAQSPTLQLAPAHTTRKLPSRRGSRPA